MYICTCMCIYTYDYVCIPMHMYLFIHGCLFLYTCLYLYICVSYLLKAWAMRLEKTVNSCCLWTGPGRGPRGSQHNTGNDCSRGRAGLAQPPSPPWENPPFCSCHTWSSGWPEPPAAGPASAGPGPDGWPGCSKWNLLYNRSLMGEKKKGGKKDSFIIIMWLWGNFLTSFSFNHLILLEIIIHASEIVERCIWKVAAMLCLLSN